MSSILDKIKKVYNLSQLGDTGERLAAQELLDKLLCKYNISINEISTDCTDYYEFTYSNSFEEKLLHQVIYKVIGTPEFTMYYSLTNTGRRRRNRTRVELTTTQFIEIEFLYEIYKKNFYKEVNYLLSAFIQANSIFGTSSDKSTNSDSSSQISDEDYEKICKFYNLCDKVVINKQIEE